MNEEIGENTYLPLYTLKKNAVFAYANELSIYQGEN